MSDISVTAASVVAGAAALVEHGCKAGATLTAGQVVYKDAADGKLKLSDSNGGTAAVRSAYANIIAQSREYVASQVVEQQAVFLSTEAAAALRFETDMLNQAKRDGVVVGTAEAAAIHQSAIEMAAAQAKTQRLTDLVNLGKSTVTGLLTDMRNGLQQGESVWQSFGEAATNALNKISDKLVEMAVSDLFDQAFGGAKGAAGAAGGGLFSGIGGWLGGLFGGGGATSGASVGAGLTTVAGIVNAKGNVFDRGNVIPFARGDVFTSPTTFGLSGNRMGLMAEAGPEAIMPLQRGPGGRLGVSVHGGAPAQQQPQRVEIHLMSDMLDARIASGADVRIVKASPSIEGRAVKQSTRLAPAAVARQPAEREGEWRTRGAG